MPASDRQPTRRRTIDNAIYDRIHATWWEEDGFMALLRTSVNPPRFDYFRRMLIDRFGLDPVGLEMLDVGCGGGLLSESFASIGSRVTGIDRSAPSLAAARAHAGQRGLSIRYLEADAAALPFEPASFDVVCCCDVLEHVDDPDAVIHAIARVLKPGGIFLFDTINRTLRSKLVAIKLAQDWSLTRLIPRDVHVWEKFIRPDEMASSLERNGLTQYEFAGLSPAMNPLVAVAALVKNKLGKMSFADLGTALKLGQSRDLSISYMGAAVRAAVRAA